MRLRSPPSHSHADARAGTTRGGLGANSGFRYIREVEIAIVSPNDPSAWLSVGRIWQVTLLQNGRQALAYQEERPLGITHFLLLPTPQGQKISSTYYI